ncbi:hypothetical protein SAMN05216574_10224 [Blastococcus tunisiensis]|uniref:AMIN-like domain-containing protein n=2 Tax=Blastococcus tunisiensis TaxID=1798228 RepID=A0A1I1XBX1_9ACTN|nr:hypothetical protein SAMN05216574_10224 [Blastococcus sp. DSM 46838]
MRFLVACGAVMTLTACAGGIDGTGAQTDTRSAGTTTTMTDTAAGGRSLSAPDALSPLGEPTTDPVESDGYPGTGEPALLTDVRVAGQETFDRVVLEFADQVPGYRVQYVEPPITADGSGRTVEIPGEAYLQITAQPASGVDLSGDQPRPTYDGPARIDPPYGEVITEAVRTGDFEGVLTWTVGLEEQLPYGVVTLQDPPRLVVDVRHQADGGDGGSGEGIEPVGPGATDDVSADGSGEPVLVTDVRLGAHDGFDRIVFEVAGEGEAGWQAGYVQDPTAQGSGEPIDVAGDATLEITLTNVALPGDAPEGVQPWDQQERLAIRDGQVIEELIVDGLFEGRYAFYAGLTGQLPFAVERFEDPQRIVVDVQTERPEDVVLSETCTSPAGFSVGYPSDWAVNSGETVPSCSRFAPANFNVPEATGARIAATAFSIEPVAFDRVTQERPGEMSREQLTVDGRDAVRIERETQDGLYPAGTPITSYAIPLEDGESGPRTLVADTVGLPAFDYQRNVAVLDAQVESLDLDAEPEG